MVISVSDLGVIEFLSVALKGLRGLLEEYQDALHAASWHVETDVQ